MKQVTKPAFEQTLTGDRKKVWKEQKKLMKKQGWKFDEYSMEKIFSDRSVCIEFCIGDFCVGLYSEPGKGLLEPKKRCESFIEAITTAYLYEFDLQKN